MTPTTRSAPRIAARSSGRINRVVTWKAGREASVRFTATIDANHQGQTVEKMGGKGGGPQLRPVNASDADLTGGKLKETREIGLDIGRRQTLRQEDDLPAAAFDHHGEGIVVAEGILPGIEHADLLEDGAADGGASAPAEVLVMRAEHGDDRGVPRRQEGRRGSPESLGTNHRMVVVAPMRESLRGATR